jgi:uncharacterized protein (DUF2147 family)
MNRISLSFAADALFALGTAPAFAAEPSGIWINAERDTKIRVSKCGQGLCGAVAWLGDPNDAQGKPKTDRHNADASKRGRKLIGVPVLIGMKPDGPDKWSGQIYNADDGKIYKSYITLAGDSTMNVQGCVLGGLFCKSMTWTRSN